MDNKYSIQSRYKSQSNIVALEAAIKSKDTKKLRQLLERGSESNHKSLMSLALKSKNVEIVKLMVQYGCKVDDDLIEYTNKFKNKDLLIYILDYFNNDKKLLQKIFCTLECGWDMPVQLELLRVILDKGLPIEDFIFDSYIKYCSYTDTFGSLTPLSYSIAKCNEGFVSLLLERGADVNKKTSKGVSNLVLALKTRTDTEIFKMLLRKGADVNEKTIYRGGTFLHVFFETFHSLTTKDEWYYEYILRLSLDHEADLNVIDDHGRTPFFHVCTRSLGEIIIKELAKLTFEGRLMRRQNLDLIKYFFLRMYIECKKELQIMSNTKFYNNFTLYDIFKLRKQEKRLISLTKNEDFVEAFKSCEELNALKHFESDLIDIVQEALKKRNVLLTEEKKLHSIFKDFLPELVVCKVAYFATEQIFFNDDL